MLKEKIKKELHSFKLENRFRKLNLLENNSFNLSSNDYMGLGNDPDLVKEFYDSYPNLTLSSGSSRLISGSYPLIMELEDYAEKIYNKPTLFFNSGFDCNCCIIETFCDEDTLVISDKLNHASIHDGIMHSKANLIRYKHLDLNHLKNILEKNKNKFKNIFVISETIYSMDGDCVNLEELIKLKKNFNFYLILDEAHSFGVHSYGIAHEKNLIEQVDFLVIPLGKGGGSIGSYLVCNQLYKDYIVNRGRKFIYTTALPPVNIAWNLFILKKIEILQKRKEKLEELTNLAHTLIKKYNLKTLSTTHIISIIIGDNNRLDKITKYLNTKNYFVYGVKEPTVPKGTSRIRIGLSPSIPKDYIIDFFKELNYALNTFF
ncbi:aminotransferase class I/II-fold pyridoxal phosphate-dependent enzyme [Candidatus Cetobacterium colombiensis]|jgi:8-amino-7-oxononanoate synthase|uniref:Aminotransferase class I/II-fold pyridoxal phosphate-dependent enzyme n=1 Tax=Candidatus Cetobacterium colombiensis TaxID=3073100 RepID=A0ABU4WA25_9FUSO|nr:aminotransferase class I/II-fold pyridoxal phosphate-dependent enzyme [Candidatus Cetobacterium colombiensis]MDX8336390.1 aminotransferase class I/II-fold pyridoxal phosphate-dependent enzyme [Candidatus Cetobacterium colombiensis]